MHKKSMSDQTRYITVKSGVGGNNSVGSPELSDDDDDLYWGEASAASLASIPPPVNSGTLSKWTNYIHGWQDRYFALKGDGSLVYYKSENDTDFGCRGAISIQKATVKAHELDELRFDVSVNDCNWYLRAQNVEDRQRWMDCLEAHRASGVRGNNCFNGGVDGMSNLRRHGSAISLSSNSFSISSRPSGSAKGGRGLTEKLAEMETFRDILCRQIDTLQSYFDACSEVAAAVEEDKENMDGAVAASAAGRMEHNITTDVLVQHGLHAVDFKGEAITFKATTAGILATLSHCIDIMGQREEGWKRKLEKELSARRALEEKYKNALEFAHPQPQPSSSFPKSNKMSTSKNYETMKSVPDYEEGPHSQIGEDEFYDAVENALDKLEVEQQSHDRLKKFGQMSADSAGMNMGEDRREEIKHPLWPVIDKVTREQLHYARLLPGQDGVWELFAEDGEMRMYKREEEMDGLVVDPLKALHQVRGVTARELCHYFFSPDVRMEWETTLDQATVLEKVSNDTLLFLQLHKRIWPAAQRDACFWSHFRKVSREEDACSPDVHDTYVVCNKSATHPDAPVNQNGVLRVDLTIIFVCDTIIDPAKRNNGDLSAISRSDISCKMCYCSVINPGGWAPASVLRTVYKREYPRFLKRFTQYVVDKTKGRPIMW